jgi:chromosome segregation ATPase
MSGAAEVITALGGLTGLSTVVASVATLIQARRIRAQVSPNHGSSLADAVNRTDAQAARAGDAIERLGETLEAHSEAITRIESTLIASSQSVSRIEVEQTKTAADVMVARHQIEGLARELKGLGHEIGDIRSTRDREHGDYDARIRSLEGRA